MLCEGDIERLDAALAALAREEGGLRLRLGQLLEALGRGAVLDLGFSSLGAYAVERCERSVRWAEEARCLARRVEVLPGLRRAMAMGSISWSMGVLLARVATPADEARWLEQAESMTVRQMRARVMEAAAVADVAPSVPSERVLDLKPNVATMTPGEGSPVEDDVLGSLQSGVATEICTLTCTVDTEDAWLFEATRCLLEHLGVRGSVAQSDALLAEAQSTLLGLLPRDVLDESCVDNADPRQSWTQWLRRWRERAEALCEKNILAELCSGRQAGTKPVGRLYRMAVECAKGLTPLERESCLGLDRQVRELAALLARHALDLSKLVLRFHRAKGWRRLGYATETQYARERLGMSRSSFVGRRTLALRLEKLPAIAGALAASQIGVEAALQLVRIATPLTEAAWVERARKRTIKHLREEVSAALIAVRMAGERDCEPPEEADMAAFQALEQSVVSGRLGEPRSASAGNRGHLSEPVSGARRAWCVMLASLTSWLEGGCQLSAASPRANAGGRPSAGRVTLRLRLTRETYSWWRALEARAQRWLRPGVSWLRFLCLSVWQAWRHLLGADVAYGHIYVRDRFRCCSPVCNRRDVTPHHLQFRSAGGSDEDRNVGTVCTWCHLDGVHGGRIRATGTAEHIHWELGPRGSPCLIVHGRERMVA